MHPLTYAIPLALVLIPSPAVSATIYQCEDSNGTLTFTQLGCSTDQVQQQRLPGSTPTSATALPASAIKKPAAKTTQKTREPEEQAHAVVSIGQHDDGCGNQVSASLRRKAMIEQEVRPGMPRADVESMLGKPDTVSSQNGRVRYNYVDKRNKGRKRSVSFDEDGCVTGKP